MRKKKIPEDKKALADAEALFNGTSIDLTDVMKQFRRPMTKEEREKQRLEEGAAEAEAS